MGYRVVQASIPDLLRLLALPVFGWAAWRDVQIRRVPNETWYPLSALAVVLLAWDGWLAWQSQFAYDWRLYCFSVAVSLGFVAPMVLVFWWFRAFGGADAKAFLVVAALFPTYPLYEVAGWTLPVQGTVLGVFSLTILTNTVLLGALYPVALLVGNALAGRVSPVMIVGRVTPWHEISTAHGRLLETPDGVTRNGADLDAIRMYLRWRGATLGDLRARPTELRDPESLPETPNPPTDGAVARERTRPSTDRKVADVRETSTAGESGDGTTDGGTAITEESVTSLADSGYEDPWGAARFLNDIDHGAYGTTPTQLRDGLDVLVIEDDVWISPGIPFIVPLFFGLLVSFTYGDLLSGVLSLFGFAI